MLEVLKLATSAFLGMLAAFGVQWIKSGRDEHWLICDELCKAASQAADTASIYWLKSGTGEEIRLLEARLLGFQSRLSGLKVLAGQMFREADEQRVSAALAQLFDALTGGDYGVSDRSADPGRCNAAQVNAANVTVEVRRAYARSVALLGLYHHWSGRLKGLANRTSPWVATGRVYAHAEIARLLNTVRRLRVKRQPKAD